MIFERRELQPYAEPVTASELGEGETYFSVQYADPQMLIPVVGTWVYVGRGLDPDDADNHYYFQDVESYRQGIRYRSARPDNARFQLGSESGMKHIFEYDRALEELMKCSLRRRES